MIHIQEPKTLLSTIVYSVMLFVLGVSLFMTPPATITFVLLLIAMLFLYFYQRLPLKDMHVSVLFASINAIVMYIFAEELCKSGMAVCWLLFALWLLVCCFYVIKTRSLETIFAATPFLLVIIPIPIFLLLNKQTILGGTVLVGVLWALLVFRSGVSLKPLSFKIYARRALIITTLAFAFNLYAHADGYTVKTRNNKTYTNIVQFQHSLQMSDFINPEYLLARYKDFVSLMNAGLTPVKARFIGAGLRVFYGSTPHDLQLDCPIKKTMKSMKCPQDLTSKVGCLACLKKYHLHDEFVSSQIKQISWPQTLRSKGVRIESDFLHDQTIAQQAIKKLTAMHDHDIELWILFEHLSRNKKQISFFKDDVQKALEHFVIPTTSYPRHFVASLASTVAYRFGMDPLSSLLGNKERKTDKEGGITAIQSLKVWRQSFEYLDSPLAHGIKAAFEKQPFTAYNTERKKMVLISGRGSERMQIELDTMHAKSYIESPFSVFVAPFMGQFALTATVQTPNKVMRVQYKCPRLSSNIKADQIKILSDKQCLDSWEKIDIDLNRMTRSSPVYLKQILIEGQVALSL